MMHRAFLLGLVFTCFFAWAEENTDQKDSLLLLTRSPEKRIRYEAYLSLAKSSEDSAKIQDYLSKAILERGIFPDSVREKLLHEKLEILKKTAAYGEAIAILKEELRWAIQNGKPKEEAEIRKQMSSFYYYGFMLDSAKFQVDTAASLFLAVGDSIGYGTMLMRMGNVHYFKGEHERSLQLGIKAKDVFKNLRRTRELAIAHLHVGNIFYVLQDLDNSEYYYEEAYQLFNKVEDSIGMARTLLNHGLIYIKTKEPQKSLNLYKRAAPVVLGKGQASDISQLYSFMAEAFLGLKKVDSARKYTSISMKIDEEIKSTFGLSQNNLLWSYIYFDEGKMDSSLVFANKALSLIEGLQIKLREKQVYEQLYKIYEQKQDYYNAFEHLKKYMEIAVGMAEDDVSTRKRALSERAKLEAATYELRLLNQKKDLVVSENQLQRRYLAGISLIALFAIVLVVLLLRSNKKNKLLNESLQLKQEKIKDDLRVKESLLKEIHHRVKNNLQIISSMLSIQDLYYKDEQFAEIISECKNRINSMSMIHETLYKSEDLYEEYFSDYVRKLVQQILKTYCIDEKQIELKMDLEDFYLNLDDSVPAGLLINEIVSNSMKHAFTHSEKGEIAITLRKTGNVVSLGISDDGKGMDEKVALEHADTFGLMLIGLLASQLGADIQMTSEQGLSYRIVWKQQQEEFKFAV